MEYILTGILCLGAGYYIRHLYSLAQKGSVELKIKQRLLEAKEETQYMLDVSAKEVARRESALRETEKHKEEEWRKIEKRLSSKESLLDERQKEIDKEHELLRKKALLLDEKEVAVKKQEEEVLLSLEKNAHLSLQEAQQHIISMAEKRITDDTTARLYKLNMHAEEIITNRAKELLAGAMNRLAVSTAQELTISTVSIDSEELKGKIIGKEGRNIRAFERVTGVELLIDESPSSIGISAFDPIRREIAKIALEALLKDGRIQPARIEEEVIKAQKEILAITKQQGEKAVYECGIYNLDPRIVAILGRLHFRSSYGQNVLKHSIEMTHLAGMLAAEIGADVAIAKAGALVHDIGKALDHEVEGTHVAIGIRILEKFGADPRIITAMKSHHDDCPHESIEAVIVQTADMLSGARPGARKDTAENFLKRINDLETLVKKHYGIDSAYALQAGREIRIFVRPEEINDVQALRLAQQIAQSIENELRYPGEIKVTLIRESRITHYAR